MINQIKKRKIAHVVCSFPPNKDGTGNSAYAIVKNLTKKGYCITVFTPSFDKVDMNQNDIDKAENLKIKRLKPFFGIGNASFLPQLLWSLHEFDIVHLHYPFYGAAEFIILAKTLRGKKMKLIIHYHQDAVGNGLKSLIFKFYQFLVLPILVRISNAITCATLSYIKHSELGGYYKKNPKKFQQTYFGVDINQFKIKNEELRMNAEFKTILFVGGLDKAHSFKGVDLLLKAVNQLKFNNWKLEIVGYGDLRVNYEKLAQKLFIADRVKFLGKIDDKKLITCYNNCNIFVLPSINKTEAFGLVLLEAMANSVPVIASRLPGVDSVFDDNKQGFFVNPGDANDLAEKLTLLLNNDELALKMGRLGRKLVEEKYSWDSVVERIEEVYLK